MKITEQVEDPFRKQTNALCYFININENPKWLVNIHGRLAETLKQIIKNTEWNEGEIRIINTHGLIIADRIILVGLGNKKKLKSDTVRNTSGKLVKEIQHIGLNEYTVIIPEDFNEILIQSVVEGAELSTYNFNKYKTNKKKIPELFILGHNKNINTIIDKAKKINSGVIFARDIANLPPNDCTPSTMAKISETLTNDKLKCRILSKNYIKKQNLNGIMSVGMGSKNEPKLIFLEYNLKKNRKPIIIIGKAVTFDTGGISLKPSEKLDEMKFDKCGGCVVLGIMKSVSELELPISIVGVIPTVENMPGGSSYRPGDIIKMYNGKMAEIINTDAEGRLILSDAISYSEKKYSPNSIIDFATLTGACIVALGTNVAGFVTNDSYLATKLNESAERSDEDIWRLPLNDDYMNMIKSDIADIKNTGPKGSAGTITAAAFLAYSISNNTPWAHVDIAGTAWTQPSTKCRSYNSKGATGFGVRLMIDYLINTEVKN
ncbi:MAG: leucyl aminopeptidase [Thaumarchaeota archaeon]|nr:leucyl aminopeptidase [Nitrososphaerota archaeon]